MPDDAPRPLPEAPYESPSSRRRLWGLLAVAAVGAGAWWVLPRGDGSLARVRANGGLRVGYAVEPPFAMVTQSGDVTGESPETARLVAEQLGIGRVDWVQTEFRELVPGLRARRFDMVAAGMTITAERDRQLRFSDPMLRVQPGWLMRRAGARALPDRATAARLPALRIAVLQGSTEEAQLRAAGMAEERMLSVSEAAQGAVAVQEGRADALALSLPSVRRLAGEDPGRLLAIPALGAAGSALPDDVAFAFHPADADLQAAWNQAQAQVLGTPRHLALMASFGFTADDLPTRPAVPEGASGERLTPP